MLGGITLALLLVGVISVLLSLLDGRRTGIPQPGAHLGRHFDRQALTSLSIIGIGMIVAFFSKTVSQAFVIANFPLGVLMFLSGAIFPLPRTVLFTLGAQEIGIYDFLPPTHAVVALNKVLTLGAGLEEVVYELTALLVLSIAYFALGVWLFRRTQMR